MRKLLILSFAVCMTVLTVLSLFNFAQDAEESMILDKRAVILEKPEKLSNREFLGQIDTALGKIGADIMYRYAELDGDKPLYRYYKTSHTDRQLSFRFYREREREAGIGRVLFHCKAAGSYGAASVLAVSRYRHLSTHAGAAA